MSNKVILTGVIDRFEEKWAVIQLSGENEIKNILRKLLPRRAKEGDYQLYLRPLIL